MKKILLYLTINIKNNSMEEGLQEAFVNKQKLPISAITCLCDYLCCIPKAICKNCCCCFFLVLLLIIGGLYVWFFQIEDNSIVDICCKKICNPVTQDM
jgi:hypothetical protein